MTTLQSIPSPNPDLYTEEEISNLVHQFYAKARKDPDLGPIFEGHVIDWDAHFVQMINFWSMQLRHSRQSCGGASVPYINKENFPGGVGQSRI